MSLIQMSMAAGILVLGIVLFRSLFVHRLPKKVMIILWEIVIIRLLFPFSIPLPLPEPVQNMISMMDEEAYDTKAGLFTEEWTETTVLEDEINVAARLRSTGWETIAVIVYLIGAAIMVFGSLSLYIKDSQLFREGLPMSACEKDRLLALAVMKEKDIKRFYKVRFQISDRTATPVTYGLIRPAIVFPKGIYFKDEKEVAFCLQHELVHIKNYDNLRKLFAHMALCVHWFNPLVWVMYLLFNRDLELLCDEKVMRSRGENRQEYALALLSLAECRGRGFQTGLGFGKNAVKERIVAVMTFKKTTLIGMLAAVLAVTGALSVFVTNSDNVVQTQAVAAEYMLPGGEAEVISYTWVESIENASVAVVTEDMLAEEASSTAMDVSAQESEELPEGMEEIIEDLVNEFKQYGLDAEVTEDDYQLYFEGKPIYFFADNRKEMKDEFSGRLFLRPAGEKNGYSGVVAKYEEGKITGLVLLSKEESKEYTSRWM